MKTGSKGPLESTIGPLELSLLKITLRQPLVGDQNDPRSGRPGVPRRLWVRKSTYVLALGVIALGFSLHLYYVQELLTQFALFSLVFLLLSLAALSVFFVCYAWKQTAACAVPAARAAARLFRRLSIIAKNLEQARNSRSAARAK